MFDPTESEGDVKIIKPDMLKIVNLKDTRQDYFHRKRDLYKLMEFLR